RRVIHVTREEKAVVQMLMYTRSRAFFCAEHIQEEYANVASQEMNRLPRWETGYEQSYEDDHPGPSYRH
ncbi:hypothetical protein PMAYCL1PPCAC_08381, partial [Pristionchus mayeri]